MRGGSRGGDASCPELDWALIVCDHGAVPDWTHQLRIKLPEQSASPFAVGKLAGFLQQLVEEHPPDSFTMVVDNWATKGALRGWTEDAAAHLQMLEWALPEPERALAEDPVRVRPVLRVVGAAPQVLTGARFLARRARRPFATLTAEFRALAKRLADAPVPGATRLPVVTTLVTPIRRIGRSGDGFVARITVDGTHREARLSPDALDAAFLALKRGVEHRVRIQANGFVTGLGEPMEVSYAKVTVLDVVQLPQQISGKEFLRRVEGSDLKLDDPLGFDQD